MREIVSHKVNGLNEMIEITARDEPGSGGANHRYQIAYPTAGNTAAAQIVEFHAALLVEFQNGPIAEAGINGISNESLVAIVIDRLQGFQSGEFKCRENAIALTKLEEAMHWLQHRTRERMQRGVEGTSKV